MRLSPLSAGAVSAAVLAGVSVWIFAQLFRPTLLTGVWAAFIGWASYDQSGANRTALFTSSTRMVFSADRARPAPESSPGGEVDAPAKTPLALSA